MVYRVPTMLDQFSRELDDLAVSLLLRNSNKCVPLSALCRRVPYRDGLPQLPRRVFELKCSRCTSFSSVTRRILQTISYTRVYFYTIWQQSHSRRIIIQQSQLFNYMFSYFASIFCPRGLRSDTVTSCATSRLTSET